MNRHRATRIATACLLSCGLLAPILAAGCQTNSHSQGLLEEKRGAGSVSDPYIVRDPAAQKRPQGASPTTQSADQAPVE